MRLWMLYTVRKYIYTRIEDVPPRPVALVLGAGLWADGSLTPVLADRVATAADLYHAGMVQKLLLSGDSHSVNYNEPVAMMEYAVRLGVPEDAILLDYAGRRTYDSCYRARTVFGVERAIVVTQRFHAPRVLYLCRNLGVDAIAILADRQDYSIRRFKWEAREYLALALAWWDIQVRHPVPAPGTPLSVELSQKREGIVTACPCRLKSPTLGRRPSVGPRRPLFPRLRRPTPGAAGARS